MKREIVSFATAAVLMGLGSAATGQVLLFEDWNGQSQSYLESEWTVPQIDGFSAAFYETPSDPFSTDAWPNLVDDPQDAVSHFGGAVATWNGLSSANAISPTSDKSIKLQVDIYDNASGNKRISLGLRGSSDPLSIVELGQWNSGDANGYAHRAILFPPETAANPNWAGFPIDPALLDLPEPPAEEGGEPGPPDGFVEVAEIGPGWHTYTAVIAQDSITFEIDLFRDGFVNARDSEGEIIVGSGTPGVDASITYDATQVDPSTSVFDSLRIGGPSNVSSAGGGVLYDNILLELIDVVVAGLAGDFNGSGSVEQADLDLVLTNWGGARTFEDGVTTFASANVDQEELDIVLTQWGSSTAPSFEGFSVPEPATLALLGLGGMAMLRRRSA